MGRILNPTNNNSFIKLVNCKDTGIFIDKTAFIEKLNERVDTVLNFVAVTRPRRFGKTVTAHILLAYYSKAYTGLNIFDTLKITNKEYKASYEKHLNKYDVIYVDMNSIRDKYNDYIEDEDQHVKGVSTLVDFLKYSIIQELKENEDFASILNNNKIGKKSLVNALWTICQYTQEKFIFIMDERDLIYRDYREDTKLQEDFINLLRSLFKSDDGKACFSLAYLTGILPIKKYNSQSALNEFKEYNMLRPIPYEKYFGFTEEEIFNIVKLPQCNITYQELKDWYKGYKLNGIDIYNPNSVVSAIGDNKCKSYWSHTSSNEEVVRLINMNFDGIKDDIFNLIEGSCITFNCSTFQNDMVSIKCKDDVFSLLVCLGYLGCIDEEGDNRVAYVPNKEIKNALAAIVKSQVWFNSMPIIERSEMLFEAIRSLDANKVAKIITEIHNSPNISLLSYNREESMFFCLISALMWRTDREYETFRELHSGKGSADLIYVPKRNHSLPILLIEFKYDQSAENAIKQIKEKEYFSRYLKGEYPNDILLIGINYEKKSKNHQCLIEKFQSP